MSITVYSKPACVQCTATTRALLAKGLSFEVVDLTLIDSPFVLICPTFADGKGRCAVPKPVIRVLNDARIRHQLRGVIAAGNRNFGATFALAGDVIARKCYVPVLYRFELAGTQNDIRIVRQGLELFCTQQHSNRQ